VAEPLHEDPLERLRERIRLTQEAADRLAREAAAEQAREEAGAAPHGDPLGEDAWERAGSEPRLGAGAADLQAAIAALLDLTRSLLPRELQDQVLEFVRELLRLLRAVIDWYLHRLEARHPAAADVQDIPIE
jgi:hypothetical protein